MNLMDKLSALGTVLADEPMRNHTTYKVGGTADYFIVPNTFDDLAKVMKVLKEENVPHMILGKGSNVLFSDQPYRGVVVSVAQNHDTYEFDEETMILTAQAGCSLIGLSLKAMEKSLGGLEFASGIPGSIGGALFMNAGAYNAAISDILIDVQVLKGDEIVWMNADELDYTYRHSNFQKHRDWIILQARLQLHKKDKEEISHLIEERKRRRMESQPYDKPCAGSVFRNPEGMAAWKIVDDLGYRGKMKGSAKVSEKHSNFIVNEDGQAKAKDVDALIREIQQLAKEKFDVELVTEIERINWK